MQPKYHDDSDLKRNRTIKNNKTKGVVFQLIRITKFIDM